MYGNTVRCQFTNLFKSPLYHVNILTRKTYDQIHVNVIVSQLSCQMKRFFCLLHSMSAADNIQGFLIHSLWIYGNSCYRILPDRHQLFTCNTVRSAGFHSKLCQSFIAKSFSHCIQELTDLMWKQCSRGTAANIDGVQFSSLHHKSSLSYLTAESFHIFICSLLPHFQRIGAEGTIQTDTWAKRDSNIKAVSIFIVNILQNLSFPVCNSDGKRCFLRTYQISLTHLPGCFRIFHSGFDHSHCQFGRTYSCQISPWKSSARQFYQQLIQSIFDIIFILFSQSMSILYSTACILFRKYVCGNYPFLLCFLFRQILCPFVFYDITVIIPFHTEAEVILCFSIFIKSMYLRFGIKRFDQFINIMFKISVLKQNAYFTQMDYTSFHNQ